MDKEIEKLKKETSKLKKELEELKRLLEVHRHDGHGFTVQ